jgi:hypothetical protein
MPHAACCALMLPAWVMACWLNSPHLQVLHTDLQESDMHET